MKHPYLLAAAAVTILFTGYEVERTIGSDPAAPTSGDGAAVENLASGEALLASIDWNLSAWSVAPAGRCPPGHILAARIGNGGMTRMGRTKAVATHCLNPIDRSFTKGRLTITAANGDQLRGTYHGHTFGSSPQIGWVSYLLLDGGTGRFVSAFGHAEEIGRGTLIFDSATGFATGGEGWSKTKGTLGCQASSHESARC